MTKPLAIVFLSLAFIFATLRIGEAVIDYQVSVLDASTPQPPVPHLPPPPHKHATIEQRPQESGSCFIGDPCKQRELVLI
jgi:hypothetical protein